MPPTFEVSLAKLKRLSPKKLDKTSRRIRTDLASAEWKMGLCLLALKRNGAFRKLGYATLTDYAERVLNLSGRKTGLLIGAAEALEYLPLMSEAFRRGEICWGKVRAIHGLATPETERQWLEFAAAHRTGDVERKVSLSPRAWKRHQALEASIEGRPIVGPEEVERILEEEASSVGEGQEAEVESLGKESSKVVEAKCTQETRECAESGGPQCAEPAQSAEAEPCLPCPPSPPKTIRLVFELTPDQYALYEQAESRVRAQQGRRIPRAEVLELMSDTVLSLGTARARARHQVLVHTWEDGDQAWYETGRGVFPVGSEVLEEALAKGEVLAVKSLEVRPTRVSPDDECANDTPVRTTRVSPDDERSDDTPAKTTRVSPDDERSDDTPAKTTRVSPDDESADDTPAKTTRVSPDDECADDTPAKTTRVSSSDQRDAIEAPKATPLVGPSRFRAYFERGEATDELILSEVRDPMVRACEAWEACENTPDQRLVSRENLRVRGAPKVNRSTKVSEVEACDSSTELTAPKLPIPETKKRAAIPNSILRQLFARAGHRCERCGAKGRRLDVHHTTPVSEGGGDALHELELLCRACHTLDHEKDLVEKPHWRAARLAAIRGRADHLCQGSLGAYSCQKCHSR
jgi:HNH endonuclease